MKITLTDRTIKAKRPKTKAYDIYDAVVPGLALNVLPSSVKRFVLIKRFPGSKHPTRRVLGAYGALTLEAARGKAREWLALIVRGGPPHELDSVGERVTVIQVHAVALLPFVPADDVGLDLDAPGCGRLDGFWVAGDDRP